MKTRPREVNQGSTEVYPINNYLPNTGAIKIQVMIKQTLTRGTSLVRLQKPIYDQAFADADNLSEDTESQAHTSMTSSLDY